MALPVSGPISLGQIAAEFGGAAPHSLSEYYAKTVGIPASGTISFSHFRGKSNKGWTFVGAGPVSRAQRASFPSTAMAGDLAVWCGASNTISDRAPDNFTKIAPNANPTSLSLHTEFVPAVKHRRCGI